jgi:hypothetical protein
LFQGFYFSPPVESDTFLSLVNDRSWLTAKNSRAANIITPSNLRRTA